MSTIQRFWMTVGAMVGWLALLLQLYLTVRLSLSQGKGFFTAVIFYLGFFTILTNLRIAAQFSLPLWLPESGLGKWFSRPTTQASSATSILIVGIVYFLLLRHVWSPQGAQKLADILLHDAIPILYLGYWLIFASKSGLRWIDSLRWLVYPLLYLIYSLTRGFFTGEYPYPFVDAGVLGYPHVLKNSALLTMAFVAIGLAVIFTGRCLQAKGGISSRPFEE